MSTQATPYDKPDSPPGQGEDHDNGNGHNEEALELFAAHALSGILAGSRGAELMEDPDAIVARAYTLAKALVEEIEEEEDGETTT